MSLEYFDFDFESCLFVNYWYCSRRWEGLRYILGCRYYFEVNILEYIFCSDPQQNHNCHSFQLHHNIFLYRNIGQVHNRSSCSTILIVVYSLCRMRCISEECCRNSGMDKLHQILVFEYMLENLN